MFPNLRRRSLLDSEFAQLSASLQRVRPYQTNPPSSRRALLPIITVTYRLLAWQLLCCGVDENNTTSARAYTYTCQKGLL